MRRQKRLVRSCAPELWKGSSTVSVKCEDKGKSKNKKGEVR